MANEVTVKLLAEVQSATNNIKKFQQSTEKSLKGVEKSVDGLSGSFSAVSRTLSSFAGNVLANAVTGAFNQATSAANNLFQTFVVDGISASNKQEDAVKQLETALKLAGDASQGASQDIQAFASSLQQSTSFGDEVIIQQVALAKAFGTTNEQAKSLVNAAIDLSAATGISLDSAVKNLGKTYSGLTGELGESLPALRALTAEQLKAGGAIELVTKRFGGAAQAQVKTFSGAVAQLGNTFGDLQEVIGSQISQNPAVLAGVRALNDVFKSLQGVIKENQQSIAAFIRDGIVGLIQAIPSIVESFQSVLNIGEAVSNTFSNLIDGITNFIARATGENEAFFAAIEEQQAARDQAFAARIEAREQFLNRIAEITEASAERAKKAADTEKKLDNEIVASNANKLSKIEAQENQYTLKQNAILENRLEAGNQFFGNFAALSKTKNRELFEIGKVAATAQAIVNVAQGVTKALATFPPPFSFAVAASVAAAGAVQIASISSQNLAGGIDEVPRGFNNDTFPANLSTGERVVPAETNKDLKEFLKTGGRETNALLSQLVSEVRSLREQSISVNVDGQAIFDVVRRELEGGRVLKAV